MRPAPRPLVLRPNKILVLRIASKETMINSYLWSGCLLDLGRCDFTCWSFWGSLDDWFGCLLLIKSVWACFEQPNAKDRQFHRLQYAAFRQTKKEKGFKREITCLHEERPPGELVQLPYRPQQVLELIRCSQALDFLGRQELVPRP